MQDSSPSDHPKCRIGLNHGITMTGDSQQKTDTGKHGI